MIASSTTRPIASTIASSVSELIEKPNSAIRPNVPISESGMVTSGITSERSEPRKRKITTPTIAMASPSETITSCRDARTSADAS